MSAAKHTPGPWETELLPGGAFWVMEPARLDMQAPATIARRGEWSHRAEESHANARLIAAAPEMLALLKDWREACGPMVHDELASLTDAAIAKATGEAA